VQDQPGDRPMRRDMKRAARAQTCAIKHNWLAIRMVLQFVERRENCRPDPRKPRRTSAAAKPGIIHSPDFNRAIVPCVSLFGHPALRAIGVAVEPQNVSIHATVLLRSV
jgi:hypothetical protein